MAITAIPSSNVVSLPGRKIGTPRQQAWTLIAQATRAALLVEGLPREDRLTLTQTLELCGRLSA